MLKSIVTVLAEIMFGSAALWRIAVSCIRIFGLWGLFAKCGVKPWKALIPFVREYNLALCADHEMEGRTLAVISVLNSVNSLVVDGIGVRFPTFIVLLLGSISIAMLVVGLVYTVRISVGLCEIFGRR